MAVCSWPAEMFPPQLLGSLPGKSLIWLCTLHLRCSLSNLYVRLWVMLTYSPPCQHLDMPTWWQLRLVVLLVLIARSMDLCLFCMDVYIVY